MKSNGEVKFQRRHYEFLAKVLGQALSSELQPLTAAQAVSVSRRFARALESTNPNFDFERFLDAIEFESDFKSRAFGPVAN